MNRTVIIHAIIAVILTGAIATIDHPLAWLFALVASAYLAGRESGSRGRDVLEDRIHYMEHRVDRIGDLGLETEVRMLRRRLAGLLASPKVYARARRIIAPLDLPPGELTEELELITSTDRTPFDWPDLVLRGADQRVVEVIASPDAVG